MPACPSCATENPNGAKFCIECGAKLIALAAREERKVVTALFCDLVGSTALGERLDHEDVARLLGIYHELCRRQIETHGGVVEKFIGDAVVGVFGVPAAHEDDPERAVRSALRIVEEVAASDLGIEIRIGVNTGEALVRLDADVASGQGFATGDTMNTAARLEAAAPVMGIAVGEATFKATRDQIVYEDLERIRAKGKAEPVLAYRAVRTVSRVGTPERDRTPFVGRDVELQVLTQLFERSRTRNQVGFVTLVADPGIGKSRLVRELGRYVDSLPDLVTWREGRCLPYGDGVSFWALGEIVKAQAGILETDDQATLSAKLDGAITEPDPVTRTWLKDRLAPLVGLESDTSPPQQEEAFTAWRRFIEQLGAQGPTVLLVEDLHWADDAFVAFLEHLGERAVGIPLLVVITARPEIEERHPCWPPGGRSAVLTLAPLADDDIVDLITSSASDFPADVLALVLERAGGSPLYAEQLVAMLREDPGLLSQDSPDRIPIPQTVQALISARIDRLPDEAKRVLMEASVVGKTFWAGAVGALGEHRDLAGTLAELVRRQLLRPANMSTRVRDEEFGFWHALVRDVAYMELTRADRARMHVVTARWIADGAGDVLAEEAEVVLHHLDASRDLGGSAEDTDELLHTALVGAGREVMRTDVDRAVRFHERALQVLAIDDLRRLRVSTDMGRALLSLGRLETAAGVLEPLLEELLTAGDHGHAVEVVMDLESVLWESGDGARGEALVRDVRRRLGDDASEGTARLLAWEAVREIMRGRFDKAIALAEDSISMAESIGARAPARALATLGWCQVGLGDEGGEEVARRAADAFLAEGDIQRASDVLFNLGVLLASTEPARSLSIFDECIDLATRTGAESAAWTGRSGKLSILVSQGRFDEVAAEAGLLSDWATASGNAFARFEALKAIAAVDRHRGERSVDPGELAAACRGFENDGGGGLTLAAALSLVSEDASTSRDLLIEAVAVLGTEVLADATRVALAVGQPGLVRELVDDREANLPDEVGSKAQALGLLAEHDGELATACERFRKAAEAFAGLGAKVDQAWSLQGLGRCLLKMGDIEEGRARLLEARDLWDAMKATLRIAEIDELLAR